MKASNKMTYKQRLEEIAKIGVYVRKHTDVLKSVGNSEEEASTLIFNRLKEAVNSIEEVK